MTAWMGRERAISRAVLTAVFLLLSGLGGPPAFAAFNVVTTTTDLKSFVEHVAGDKVQVVSLVPPGADAEAYVPRPQDLSRLRAANMVVRVGLDYDLWLDRLIRQSERLDLAKGRSGYVDASNAIVLLEVKGGGLSGGGHAHGVGNPHYWLDPANAAVITGNIVEALARLDPANAKFYEQKRTVFLAELEKKIAQWQERLAPLRGKPLIAYHNEWPYFARRFRLNFAGIIESRPGVAPSAAELGRLLDQIQKTGISLIVKRVQDPSKEVAYLSKRSGAQIVVLSASVGDSLGNDDYMRMMDDNVAALVAAMNRQPK